MEQIIKHRKYTIEIKTDELAANPRTEWDNLGTMVCFHKRYNLGDKHDFSSPDDLNYFFKRTKNIRLPLYLFDHSGITMQTAPFSCPWDSGQVGYIYVTYEKIREEYMCDRISEKLNQNIHKYLTQEVKTYDHFLKGEAYGFVVTDPLDNEIDSCWGHYGDEVDAGIMMEIKQTIDLDIIGRSKSFRKLWML